MIVLPCPHCGPRDVGEFVHLGELVARPDPGTTTPQAWRSYLYDQTNPAGPVRERWYHRAGCRRYLDVVRDTTDNTVHASAPAGGLP